ELRAPIAVLHGISTTLVLREHELTPDQAASLRSALYEQSGRLRELAEQLLDLSRLESAPPARPRERIPLREHVETLLARLVPERREDVEVEIEPGLAVETDPGAVDRIVGNLILNALRHGDPPVTVSAERGPGVTRLVVEDRGAGVPPEFAPHLFERFTRSER